jgi:hypothetical protein
MTDIHKKKSNPGAEEGNNPPGHDKLDLKSWDTNMDSFSVKIYPFFF